VEVRRPHNIRMVVDFPAPFGPRKPKISPRSTVKERRSTAVKVPNTLVRASTAMTAGVESLPS
jgi:hypothetical protein